MPRGNSVRTPNYKNIFIVVGVILLFAGIGVMFMVDGEDALPWTEKPDAGGVPSNTTTTTDVTNTTTTTTDTTTTTTDDPTDTSTTTTTDPSDPVLLPSGLSGMRVYGLDEQIGMVLITPAYTEIGLYAGGYTFIEFLLEPVVIGDVSMLEGEPFTIDWSIDSLTAVSAVGTVDLIDAPIEDSFTGTVNGATTDMWIAPNLIPVAAWLPGSSFTLEDKLVDLAWLQNRDIWNYDISIVTHCNIAIGDYVAVVSRVYSIEFRLGDNPAAAGGSIHSLSVTDNGAVMLETAQMLAIVGVAVIGVSLLPIGELFKRTKRRRK